MGEKFDANDYVNGGKNILKDNNSANFKDLTSDEIKQIALARMATQKKEAISIKEDQKGALQIVGMINPFDTKIATDDKDQKNASDFENLLKNREENKKMLEQYGLNEYLVKSLIEQGITIDYRGEGINKYPNIDTSNLYHGFLDQDGNIKSGKMSALPIIGYKIDSISRSSDGITIFKLTDTRTGEKTNQTFSMKRFEDIPYANQLQLGKTERENAKRRDRVKEEITNPKYGEDKYGLNDYLTHSLEDQGIPVKYVGEGANKYPHIDTSKVHLASLDKDNIRSGMINSLPVNNQYIESISRSSDGFTTFSLVDTNTGKLQKYIFSKEKWENAPEEAKIFYKEQLKK